MHARPPIRGTHRSEVRRSGFTLVELLISITIFSILAVLAIGAFRDSEQDRVKAGAQLLRSMIEGARSRAIHDQLPRGIRLIADPNNAQMITSVVYIGAPEQFAGTLDDIDGDGDTTTFKPGVDDVDDNYPGMDDDADMMTDEFDEVDNLDEYGWDGSNDAIIATVDPMGTPGFTPTWRIRENRLWPRLRQRHLLGHTGEFIGARIRIPAKQDTWYPIVGIESPYDANQDPDVPGAVRITIAGQFPYVAESAHVLSMGGTQVYAKVSSDSVFEYVIELAPPILPGSVPQSLPNGVAIDLRGSKLPQTWNATGATYDILFTPRGDVTGSAAAAGVMHFAFAEIQAIVEGNRYQPPDLRAPVLAPDATTTTPPHDRLVTLFTRTGQVTTSQVNHFDPTDSAYGYALAGKDAP